MQSREKLSQYKKCGLDSMDERKLIGAQLQEKVSGRQKKKPQAESRSTSREHEEPEGTETDSAVTVVVFIQINNNYLLYVVNA